MWAERLRRRAAAAGEKRNEPRLAIVVLGGLALVGYAVAALARLGVSVLAQRSFDAFFFDRWSVVAYVAGQPRFQLAARRRSPRLRWRVRGGDRGPRAACGSPRCSAQWPCTSTCPPSPPRPRVGCGGRHAPFDFHTDRDGRRRAAPPTTTSGGQRQINAWTRAGRLGVGGPAPPLCRYIITEINSPPCSSCCFRPLAGKGAPSTSMRRAHGAFVCFRAPAGMPVTSG